MWASRVARKCMHISLLDRLPLWSPQPHDKTRNQSSSTHVALHWRCLYVCAQGTLVINSSGSGFFGRKVPTQFWCGINYYLVLFCSRKRQSSSHQRRRRRLWLIGLEGQPCSDSSSLYSNVGISLEMKCQRARDYHQTFSNSQQLA